MINELKKLYRGPSRHYKTSFEEEIPVLLEFLRKHLEFEPTTFDFGELCNHLKNSVALYNRDTALDRFSIGNAAYEAVIRFLHYDYGVIKDEIDFSRQFKENKSGLITKLKRQQALRHHWDTE